MHLNVNVVCTIIVHQRFEIFSSLLRRFSEPRFSEILDLMNKLQYPFSYFTLYRDPI